MRKLAPSVATIALLLAGCGSEAPEPREAPETVRARLAAAPPAFAACLACHTVEKGRSGSGPSLVGVFGRKAGALPGYPYSPALAASGLTWDAATLDRWLAAPVKLVPGTRMVMPVTDPAARRALVGYLETLK